MGVDVCSGVERGPGKKDLFKITEFVKGVRKADETTG
jgi:phosphoribosylanthranilate isomerase